MLEKKLTEVEVKLGSVELKLAEAKSLSLTQADEIANLKVAFEAYEEKWYNEGFADAENSVEPIVHQARFHGFGEGWLAALQAMGVAEDSPLRNPKKIPYPTPFAPAQSQAGAADEEDTPMWRLLISRSPATSMLPKMHKSSNLPPISQPRMSQTGKPRMQSIPRPPILQSDT